MIVEAWNTKTQNDGFDLGFTDEQLEKEADFVEDYILWVEENYNYRRLVPYTSTEERVRQIGFCIGDQDYIFPEKPSYACTLTGVHGSKDTDMNFVF
jgi:hypothetical protein